jgi:hypothetical protein
MTRNSFFSVSSSFFLSARLLGNPEVRRASGFRESSLLLKRMRPDESITLPTNGWPARTPIIKLLNSKLENILRFSFSNER